MVFFTDIYHERQNKLRSVVGIGKNLMIVSKLPALPHGRNFIYRSGIAANNKPKERFETELKHQRPLIMQI